MYLEARITQEEYEEIKAKYGKDKFRPLFDLEEEVCRQALDVCLSNYNYENNIEMSEESFNNIIEDKIDEVTDMAREEVFSELYDKVYEIIEEHFQ